MNRIMTFGEFEGKSFEWLFFNAPWYANWLHEKDILAKRWDYGELDRAYFRELHKRASALAGRCPYCKEREIVRKALSTVNGSLGATTYCCKECVPITEGLVTYQDPSFFLRYTRWPRVDQKNLTSTIKGQYLGWEGNLTQKRMEEFFRIDEFFWYATPNFFEDLEAGL